MIMSEQNEATAKVSRPSSVDIELASAASFLAERMKAWAECRPLLDPVVAAFQRMHVDPTIGYGWLFVTVCGNAKALTDAFRIMRGAGFNTTQDRPKEGDSSWNASFSHPDSTTSIYFTFSSTVCRRVKVRQEMVLTDIYETQCGDDDEPSAAPSEDPAPQEAPVVEVLYTDNIPF